MRIEITVRSTCGSIAPEAVISHRIHGWRMWSRERAVQFWVRRMTFAVTSGHSRMLAGEARGASPASALLVAKSILG